MSLSRDDEDDDDDAKSVASRTPSTAGLLALKGRIAPEAGKDREMEVWERQLDAAVLSLKLELGPRS
jgi:hypothetical protein